MSVEWTVFDEIRLLRWITQFKPVGIHKHFHMMSILERMNNPSEFPITFLQDEKPEEQEEKTFTANDIRWKLSQYYNLDKLDELEDSPSDDRKEEESIEQEVAEDEEKSTDFFVPLRDRIIHFKEFSLPWDEYGELMLENAVERKDHVDSSSSSPVIKPVSQKDVEDAHHDHLENDTPVVKVETPNKYDDLSEPVDATEHTPIHVQEMKSEPVESSPKENKVEKEEKQEDKKEDGLEGDEEEIATVRNGKRKTRSAAAVSKTARVTRSARSQADSSGEDAEDNQNEEVDSSESDERSSKKARMTRSQVTSSSTSTLSARSRRKSLPSTGAVTRTSARVASRLRNKK